jgi:hypothetical protein
MVLIALAAAPCWWAASRWAALRRHLPGTYTAAALGKAGTAVIRLAPDGSYRCDEYAPGAAQPQTTFRGWWRLSGRVLVVEVGATPPAPLGLVECVSEMFDQPVASPSVSKCRVISADDTQLVLDLGNGIASVLRRKPDEP